MNVRLMKRLILILEEVIAADGGFNMKHWGQGNAHCGTSCCAMGYAALDPEFRKAGLRMELFIGVNERGRPQTVAGFNRLIERHSPAQGTLTATLRCGSYYDLDAVEVVLDLDGDLATHLFMPTRYADRELGDPTAVIKRLKQALGDARP